MNHYQDKIKPVIFCALVALALALFGAGLWSIVHNPTMADQEEVLHFAPLHVVDIDHVWLDAHGPAPYYLDQPGTEYILQADVSADGTAFAIIADNVTLNLNGHTITYDNEGPGRIENGSFELASPGGTAPSWDFSGAPNCERFAGEFLKSEIYDGEYSVRFSGFAGEQAIKATGTVALHPNTTYSLSGMFYNQGWAAGVSSFVRLVGSGAVPGTAPVPVAQATWSGKNNRGIQFVETSFTTGPEGGTYQVECGARNPNGVADFVAWIDDLKIQRTHVYGVAVGVRSPLWQYPGITRTGNSNNSTVTDGAIYQGGGATSSHAIYDRGDSTTVTQTTITVNGAKSSGIYGPWAKTANIGYNTINSDVTTIGRRDGFEAAVIRSGGWIHHNTIRGGPHCGIVCMGTASAINGNTIRIRARYTNAFGILCWNDLGSDIYRNAIDLMLDDFGGRGIMVDRKHHENPDDLTMVRENFIAVRELARNQESAGTVAGGAYGIQLERARNVEVWNNLVHAFAEEGPAFALRLNHLVDDHNITIHGNRFIATQLHPDHFAAALKLTNVSRTSGVMLFENIFESNCGWVGESTYVDGFELYANTFAISGSGADLQSANSHPRAVPAPAKAVGGDPDALDSRLRGNDVVFIPVQGDNWGTGQARDDRAIRGLRFVDNKYTSELAQTAFETSPIANKRNPKPEFASWIYGASGTIYTVEDQQGKPVAGAIVTIRDKDSNVVFTGTTDEQGEVLAIVNHWTMHGEHRAEFGPFDVEIVKPMGPAL